MNFKKIISAFTAFSIAAGASALNVNADADNGFTKEEISASEIKPYITLTKQVLSIDEARSSGTVTVYVMVDTDDYSYAATGLHIYYDPRLEIKRNIVGNPKIEYGSAAQYLMFNASIDSTAEEYGMKGIFISTAGDYNKGEAGILAGITFFLPDDIREGDVYPLDIVYTEGAKAKDTFTTFNDDAVGKRMQAWAFTQGIYNPEYNNNFYAPYSDIDKCWNLITIDGSYDGYIAIADPVMITTTIPTTTTTRTTEKTTTTKAVTTTTARATTKTTTTTRTTTTTKPDGISTISGDANCDNELSVADATLILQYCGNKDKYKLSEQGFLNADVDGTPGISPIDALIIQQVDAGIYDISDLPLKK